MSAGTATLAELRNAFDSAFAREPAAPVERLDLVAVRAAGTSYAVRLSEIAGVERFAGVISLPCGEPAFLGLAAIHGVPLPVYDLAALVGGGASQDPGRILLTAGADRVALALDEVEGYLRIAFEQLVPAAADPPAPHVAELVRAGPSLLPVVSLPSVVRELKRRLGERVKER